MARHKYYTDEMGNYRKDEEDARRRSNFRPRRRTDSPVAWKVVLNFSLSLVSPAESRLRMRERLNQRFRIYLFGSLRE